MKRGAVRELKRGKRGGREGMMMKRRTYGVKGFG